MVRTQIQLSEEQARRVKRAATQAGVSMAEIIRRGVDRVLSDMREAPREFQVNRALAAVGRFTSSEHDVSARHDDYFADSLS